MTDRAEATLTGETRPGIRGTPVSPEPPYRFLEALRDGGRPVEKERGQVIVVSAADLYRVWVTPTVVTAGMIAPRDPVTLSS